MMEEIDKLLGKLIAALVEYDVKRKRGHLRETN